jgi:hypothetical protein
MFPINQECRKVYALKNGIAIEILLATSIPCPCSLFEDNGMKFDDEQVMAGDCEAALEKEDWYRSIHQHPKLIEGSNKTVNTDKRKVILTCWVNIEPKSYNNHCS